MNKTPHILFLMILGFFMVEPSNAIANAFSPQNVSVSAMLVDTRQKKYRSSFYS